MMIIIISKWVKLWKSMRLKPRWQKYMEVILVMTVIDQGLQILRWLWLFRRVSTCRSIPGDDRINQIWEGTNEVNRQIIAGFIMKKALMEELPFREAIR